MNDGKLGVIKRCAGKGIPGSIQDACTLLCRTFAVADELDITAIKHLVLEELQAVFFKARESGMCTPLLPDTVMEVWLDRGGESDLWEVLFREMCVAFSSTPLPAWKDYDECFKTIDPLRLAVANSMVDKIREVCR